MKFSAIAEGRITERWRWLLFRDEEGAEAETEVGGEEMRLELYIPPRQEFLGFLSRYRLGSDRAEWRKAIERVAKRWFRGFEGKVEDRNGVAIENTEQNRRLMLNSHPRLFDWIVARLNDATQEDEGDAEGKPDGADA